jgi:hypothetical protein
MFTVTEHVTKDPKYGNYKRDMLYGNRQFSKVIVDYGNFIDDLLQGRNKVVIRQAIEQLFAELGNVIGTYLQAKNKNPILVALVPAIAQGIGHWFSGLATRFISYIHDPQNQSKLQGFIKDAGLAILVLRIAGLNKLADSADKFINDYGKNINHQGLVDAADSIRSYLTTNLFYFPMVALTSLEQDPATVDIYKGCIERNWQDINDEHNPVVNLVHAGYGFGAGPNDVPDSLSALTLFPTDLGQKKFDHTNDPGVVLSRWPDRFGRVGHVAIKPHFFPINERGIDIFPWRSHPRTLISGANNPNTRIAPLGYLSAYWIGRDRGLIDGSQ